MGSDDSVGAGEMRGSTGDRAGGEDVAPPLCMALFACAVTTRGPRQDASEA